MQYSLCGTRYYLERVSKDMAEGGGANSNAAFSQGRSLKFAMPDKRPQMLKHHVFEGRRGDFFFIEACHRHPQNPMNFDKKSLKFAWQ